SSMWISSCKLNSVKGTKLSESLNPMILCWNPAPLLRDAVFFAIRALMPGVHTNKTLIKKPSQPNSPPQKLSPHHLPLNNGYRSLSKQQPTRSTHQPSNVQKTLRPP